MSKSSALVLNGSSITLHYITVHNITVMKFKLHSPTHLATQPPVLPSTNSLNTSTLLNRTLLDLSELFIGKGKIDFE